MLLNDIFTYELELEKFEQIHTKGPLGLRGNEQITQVEPYWMGMLILTNQGRCFFCSMRQSLDRWIYIDLQGSFSCIFGRSQKCFLCSNDYIYVWDYAISKVSYNFTRIKNPGKAEVTSGVVVRLSKKEYAFFVIKNRVYFSDGKTIIHMVWLPSVYSAFRDSNKSSKRFYILLRSGELVSVAPPVRKGNGDYIQWLKGAHYKFEARVKLIDPMALKDKRESASFLKDKVIRLDEDVAVTKIQLLYDNLMMPKLFERHKSK